MAADVAEIASMTKNRMPPKSLETVAVPGDSNSQASLEALLSPTSQGVASTPVLRGGLTSDVVPDGTSKSKLSASFSIPVVAEFTCGNMKK